MSTLWLIRSKILLSKLLIIMRREVTRKLNGKRIAPKWKSISKSLVMPSRRNFLKLMSSSNKRRLSKMDMK